MLYSENLDTLATCRNDLSQKFFLDITEASSCLHYLLHPTRYQSVISRLRTFAKLPRRVYTRTKRYCSFINYMHLIKIITARIKRKLTNKVHMHYTHTQLYLNYLSCCSNAVFPIPD